MLIYIQQSLLFCFLAYRISELVTLYSSSLTSWVQKNQLYGDSVLLLLLKLK